MDGRAPIAVATIAALLTGCGGSGGGTPKHALPNAPARMTLTSSAFAAGGTIPKPFTCSSTAPPLAFRGAPPAARELAILMRDLDAPGGEFRHWSGWGIAAKASGTLPAPRFEGRNDFGDDGYGGPCPPKGDNPHTYVFTIYAVAHAVDASAGAKADAVNQALAKAQPLASGELRGKFGR